MGLAERMAQPIGLRGLSGQLCKTAKQLEQLGDDDRAVFDEWLTAYREDQGSVRVGAVTMADHLTCELGERVASSTFEAHVKQRCMCYDAR